MYCHAVCVTVRVKVCVHLDFKMAKQFLVMQIKSGSKTLKNWYGASVLEKTTLMDIYAEFALGNLKLLTLLDMNVCL